MSSHYGGPILSVFRNTVFIHAAAALLPRCFHAGLTPMLRRVHSVLGFSSAVCGYDAGSALLSCELDAEVLSNESAHHIGAHPTHGGTQQSSIQPPPRAGSSNAGLTLFRRCFDAVSTLFRRWFIAVLSLV